MCGILAIIGKGKDQALVKDLSKRMSHRGPDESDIHITEKGHYLSHERLSIVDLHTGKQPIQGTSTAWMVHNGEIYNHQKLRETTLKQHRFRTTSDSEVIVHLYEEYGYDFLNKSRCHPPNNQNDDNADKCRREAKHPSPHCFDRFHYR